MIRALAPLCVTLPLLAGFPSQQEALTLAWPGASFTRKEHYLTEAQAREVRALSGLDQVGLWSVAYEARVNGKLVGVAFFDAHRVRTLNETAMVAVTTEGTVKRVEVVAFREPMEYAAKDAWMRQLDGKRLDPNLSLKREVRPLSGATLTAHALVDASRRCLALHKVLYGASK